MKKLLTHLIILTFIFSNFVNADIVDSNKLVSNFLKKDIFPDFLPRYPKAAYIKQWKGWSDFLGKK